MRNEVLLFGPQAVLHGERCVSVEIPGDAVTVGDVLEQLSRLLPELSDSLRTSRLAVNHEFANEEQVVSDGDELALIGMVSGG